MARKELSGNKGEWSEIYVFLYLLAHGRLVVADEDLNAIPNEFYKILAILRKEAETSNNYIREDDKVNIIVRNDKTQEMEEFSFPVVDFIKKANQLLNELKATTSMKHPEITDFLSQLKIYSIKDVGHKRDITIKIEDFHNGMPQTLGFSIKSFLGANSTLFNPAPGTNFIYEVIPPEGVEIDVDKFNADTYPIRGRIAARIQSLLHDFNCSIAFVKTQSNCLYQNLRTIDGDMPDLLSRLLIARFEQDMKSVQKVTQYITELNPYGFDIESHGEVYQYKVKRFLQDCAMGMTPETPWTGIYDATGGQIIVKEDGEVVCYHIYEINRFLEYLYKSTIFEGASTGEDESNPGHPRPEAKKNYFYGWLYKEHERYFIKLNLQVRFK